MSVDNDFNVRRPSSTKEVLEATTADARRYKSKIDDVKSKAESIKRGGKLRELQRPQDLQETVFLRGVGTLQAEREKFLADKSNEVEKLRQEVKRKKSAAEPAIEKFRDELKR